MKLQIVWADIYGKFPCPEHSVQAFKSNLFSYVPLIYLTLECQCVLLYSELLWNRINKKHILHSFELRMKSIGKNTSSKIIYLCK